MAGGKNMREIQFVLKPEDYKDFGHYRILYTDQGHKMVLRHRLTFIVSGVVVAILFTLFHVDSAFTKLAYVVSAALVLVGIIFSEKMVLSQQDKAIEAGSADIERVHPTTNKICFNDEGFDTYAGSDEQHFKYSDIKLVDLTEKAIYVWMSDTMIMPVPLHAFRNMDEMKEFCKWLRSMTGDEKK